MHSRDNRDDEVINTISEDMLWHLSVYRTDIQQKIATIIYFYTCLKNKQNILADKEVKENGPVQIVSPDSKKSNG